MHHADQFLHRHKSPANPDVNRVGKRAPDQRRSEWATRSIQRENRKDKNCSKTNSVKLLNDTTIEVRDGSFDNIARSFIIAECKLSSTILSVDETPDISAYLCRTSRKTKSEFSTFEERAIDCADNELRVGIVANVPGCHDNGHVTQLKPQQLTLQGQPY